MFGDKDKKIHQFSLKKIPNHSDTFNKKPYFCVVKHKTRHLYMFLKVERLVNWLLCQWIDNNPVGAWGIGIK